MNEKDTLILEVTIPERAQHRMVELDRQVKQAQELFQLYMQALLDAFELQGHWGLSPDGKKFVRVASPDLPATAGPPVDGQEK